MNQKKLVIGTVIGFVVLVGLIIFLSQMKDKDNFGEQVEHPSIEGQPTIGEENAPISIVEFGDYKCPACQSWGEQVYPKIVKDYIDNGKAKFSFVNVLFHNQESVIASLASESVYLRHPESFWDVHEAIFNNQPQDGSPITLDVVTNILKDALPDMDMEQFNKDLTEEGEVSTALQRDVDLYEKSNITVTPTIIINGTLLADPFDYKKIQKLIEHELGE